MKKYLVLYSILGLRLLSFSQCGYSDFESASLGAITTSNQVSGWTLTSGLNNPNLQANPNNTPYSPYFPNGIPGATSCNLYGCCPMPPLAADIINCSAPGGYIDNIIGSNYPIYSVFGINKVVSGSAANPQINGGLYGNKVLRLNNSTADYSIQKLSKTFLVSASNALFQLAYIPVFAPGHNCCDAGVFQVQLTNAISNTPIPCPGFSLSAPSSQCSNTTSVAYFNTGSGTPYVQGSTGTIYHPWKINALDLTAYIGQNITIDIIISDCVFGDHFSYVYLDAKCGPMLVNANDVSYDAGAAISVHGCGSVEFCASNGLGPYSWIGPGVSANYTIPSFTNQCFTSFASNEYTLVMHPEGACAPIARVMSSNITPALQVSSPPYPFDLCGNSLVTLMPLMTGSSAGSSFTWSAPPNATVSGMFTNTLITNAPGVYTITTSNTTNTCTSTAQLTVGICVGVIEEMVSGVITLYPNPAKETVELRRSKNLKSATIEIRDVTGRTLVKTEINDEKTNINLQTFAAGIYNVTIVETNRTYHLKLIKE